ncbi:MAG: DegT/DnrJ/EryC1/StrS family aminotransferase [Gemmatimonadota bacterium]
MAIRNPLRRQPPALSPVPLGAVLRGLGAFMPLVGDARDRLTELLAEEYGADRVELLGSGTQALTRAIRWAVVESEARARGRRGIALPAYSCYDVASAAVGALRDYGRGREVSIRFYDLDPETLSPDPESLRAVLAEGVDVLVLAPLFGLPVRWDVVDEVLTEFGGREGGIVVVEDAAQGFGGAWDGRPIGSEGQLSVLSFGRGKGWTGSGSGGALLRRSVAGAGAGEASPQRPISSRVPDGERGGRVLSARPGSGIGALGSAGALWGLSRPSVFGIPHALPFLELGETHYREPRTPFAMPEVTAALVLGARRAALAAVEVRQAVAREYDEKLAARGVEGRVRSHAGRAGFLRYPLRLKGGMGAFVSPERALRLGAAPGYPRALPHLKEVALHLEADEGRKRWPGAAELVDRLVTLPTHPRTRGSEREGLVGLIPGG